MVYWYKLYLFLFLLLRWFQAVGRALFEAHVEGQLKVHITMDIDFLVFNILVHKNLLILAFIQSEIMSKPELFVEPDPELPLALLDQKEVLYCNFLSLHSM